MAPPPGAASSAFRRTGRRRRMSRQTLGRRPPPPASLKPLACRRALCKAEGTVRPAAPRVSPSRVGPCARSSRVRPRPLLDQAALPATVGDPGDIDSRWPLAYCIPKQRGGFTHAMSRVRSSGGEFDAQYAGWRRGWVRSLRQLQNPRRHLPRVRQFGAGSASGGVGSGKALLPRWLAFGQCPLPQRGMNCAHLWQANSGAPCIASSPGARAFSPRPPQRNVMDRAAGVHRSWSI
jgi:hypothetical protein